MKLRYVLLLLCFLTTGCAKKPPARWDRASWDNARWTESEA